MLEKIFGKNYKTAVGSIMTATGLVPLAIQQMGLIELPEWLRVVGVACSFLSFIWSGMQQKDKDVTGAGKAARIVGEKGA